VAPSQALYEIGDCFLGLCLLFLFVLWLLFGFFAREEDPQFLLVSLGERLVGDVGFHC